MFNISVEDLEKMLLIKRINEKVVIADDINVNKAASSGDEPNEVRTLLTTPTPSKKNKSLKSTAILIKFILLTLSLLFSVLRKCD